MPETTKDNKNLIYIGVVIIIAVIVGYGLARLANIPEQPMPRVGQKSAETEVKLPTATGDVDDAVDAIIAGSSLEEIIVSEEEDDASLIGLDDQEIDSFGQTYQNNEIQ